MTDSIFQRNRLLLGNKAIEAIGRARVIVFGVGGVGSWCVESLVRSGIKDITLVDSDCVCITNINRQLMAIHEISPDCNVTPIHRFYSEDTATEFKLENYDYVIDAIDSLRDKAALILHATSTKGTKLFSSMGAALKINPLHIGVTEFWKVQGCPLAASLRRMFKKNGTFPRRKFKCVYSPELVRNHIDNNSDDMTSGRTNGSIAHITAIFGLNLAALVIQDIIDKTSRQ